MPRAEKITFHRLYPMHRVAVSTDYAPVSCVMAGLRFCMMGLILKCKKTFFILYVIVLHVPAGRPGCAVPRTTYHSTVHTRATSLVTAQGGIWHASGSMRGRTATRFVTAALISIEEG